MTARDSLTDVLIDFARTLVTDFPIQAILDELVERIVQILPVTAAGVTLIDSETSPPRYIAASNSAAMRFEQVQTALMEGPCLAAYRSNEAVAVADLRSDHRFARFAPDALEAGLVAVFAFPLRHGVHDAIGALDLYRETPGDLDADTMYAAQTLADVTTAYVLNAQARDDLKEASDRFQASALHDSLTGLPNRVLFAQFTERALLRSRRSQKNVALLFVDLDRFKEVNDLFGHHVGDQLLIAVAHRLTGLLRPDDTLARLAGDEFVVLSEGFDSVNEVHHLAERMTAGMEAPFHISGHDLHVGASIGVAFSESGDDPPERLLRDADTAMYQAKRRGGARHQVLDLGEQQQTADRATLRHDLHGVLLRDELEALYQPVVSADDGTIIGVEALMRWRHPTRGVVPPSILLPLAEASHQACDIGRWMFERACRDHRDWQRHHPAHADLHIAINASPYELLACDYVEMVESVLSATGTEPRHVIVEMTESVLIKDADRALLVLRDLKALGVRLALDDFGTGYSSLSYLHDFPVDIVKIDRSFVRTLGRDAASTAIMDAIVNLAHALDLAVVAEGMETLDQYEQMAAFSCEAYQGFYFGAPVAADEIALLLQRGLPDDRRPRPRRQDGPRGATQLT